MAADFGDVVVVIPGIGGSALARDGNEIWSPTAGAALRAVLSMGRSIDLLRLEDNDSDADELGDGISATRLLPDLHVIPGLDWKIDGYDRLRERLIARLELEPGRNYFELPYDWRRDNRVAARQLQARAPGWLAAAGQPGAKLVLVGHSMGGIVARIFLEKLGGWRQTRTLVTFGTPYSGSLKALDFLANGVRRSWGPITVDLTRTLRSFTSVYQLLPSYRCLQVPGSGSAKASAWHALDGPASVPGLDAGRLADALALHRDLRATVDAHRGTDYEGTGGYDIRPVLGDFQPTAHAAVLRPDGVVLSNRRAASEEGGDGTVPKLSAMPHELLDGWRNAAFMSEKHASLQNDDGVIDHLVGLLRTTGHAPVDMFPAGDTPVAVEVTDALLPEPAVITARTRDPGFAVEAIATPIAGGAPREVPLTHDPDRPGGLRAELRDWPTGDYRLTVQGRGVRRVTDVFSIVDPADLGP